MSYTPADLDFRSLPLIRAALAELAADRLRRMSPREFEAGVQRFVRGEVAVEEAPAWVGRPANWGHDHDFGTFKVSGRMGTRHVWMLSRFFDHFGIPPASIRGRSILDVGCWSGGVSLVLDRLGGKVVAIDAQHLRVRQLAYLAEAFDLRGLEWRWLSLYDLERAGPNGRFDMVFCLGVIYHVTDPIVALRRLYHALRPGGLLCLESMSVDSDRAICEYAGPSDRASNWFIPSPCALGRWLEDTGFEEVRVGNGLTPLAVTNERDPMGADRCFAVGRRRAEHRLADRAGMSVDVA